MTREVVDMHRYGLWECGVHPWVVCECVCVCVCVLVMCYVFCCVVCVWTFVAMGRGFCCVLPGYTALGSSGFCL